MTIDELKRRARFLAAGADEDAARVARCLLAAIEEAEWLEQYNPPNAQGRSDASFILEEITEAAS